jgi:hypothetical protein
VLRNTTDRLLYVAPGEFSATYGVLTKTSEDESALAIYSEPYVERNPPKKVFVPVEPGGIITVPIRLRTMPKIARRAFEVRIHLSIFVRSQGREEEEVEILCNPKWCPDPRQGENKDEKRDGRKKVKNGEGEKARVAPIARYVHLAIGVPQAREGFLLA